MAKILIHSNAPWSPTGYGMQTALLLKQLSKLGHEVDVSAFFGVQGAKLDTNGHRILPPGSDPYGNDILLAHRDFYGHDIVIGLLDIWVLNPELLSIMDNFYNWTPVDHDPIPPAVQNTASFAAGIISMSEFGKKAFDKIGIKNTFIPHAIDTSKLYRRDKQYVRKELGIGQDNFVIGMFMANKGSPSRKAFFEQLSAIKIFMDANSDAVLYLHTRIDGRGGEDLTRIIDLVGIDKSRVHAVPQYQYLTGMVGVDRMAELYTSCDVVMNATRGEGFGVPIIEAQACGVPVITTDFSAMPENNWSTILNTKPKAFLYTPQASMQALPDIEALNNALQVVYDDYRNNEEVVEALIEFTSRFDMDYVADNYWKPFLNSVVGVKKHNEEVLKKKELRRLKREANRAKREAGSGEL